jgi:uncharacterized MnhB-related membrane protein
VNLWLLAGITALLPVSALITVWQRRPAFALLARGMMGGVATLLYAVLGAPDVALTEALMGTFLVVLLYAITVRATLVVRVAVLAPETIPGTAPAAASCDPAVGPLRRCCHRHHLEVEFFPMADPLAAGEALAEGRVDAAFGEPARLWPVIGSLCETPAESDGPVLFLGRRLSRAPRIFTDTGTGIPICRTTAPRTP